MTSRHLPIHSHNNSDAFRRRQMTLIAFLAGLLGLTLGPSARAQFTTNAYDGFNYSTGPLTGQNGGTGWTNAWTRDYGAGGSLTVTASGLSYPGLTTEGGSVVWGSGGNQISEDSRMLPLLDSGIVYIQFLCQFGSTSGGGTPNLRLFNSGTFTGGLGGNGGTYGNTFSILDATLNPAADGSSSTSASLSALNLVVARIDYQSAMTTLWVNPDLSTFDYQNPMSPDATYAGLAPAFDKVAFYTRYPAQMDELLIMSESIPVPEPTTVSLFGLGICLALGGRHRLS